MVIEKHYYEGKRPDRICEVLGREEVKQKKQRQSRNFYLDEAQIREMYLELTKKYSWMPPY